MPNASDQKRSGYNYQRENLYTVIVIYRNPVTGDNAGAKYHNIDADNRRAWERFEDMVKRKFNPRWANLYGGVSKEYKRRVYFTG